MPHSSLLKLKPAIRLWVSGSCGWTIPNFGRSRSIGLDAEVQEAKETLFLHGNHSSKFFQEVGGDVGILGIADGTLRRRGSLQGREASHVPRLILTTFGVGLLQEAPVFVIWGALLTLWF